MSPPDDYGIVAVIDGSKLLESLGIYLLILGRMPQSNSNAPCERTTANGPS